MLPKAYVEQWKQYSPWKQDESAEQDLILSRLLIDLYSSTLISETLAFRGGTALHKLFIKSPYRFSEDLDFVQIKAGDIGEVLTEIRKIVKSIIPGNPKFKKSKNTTSLIYFYAAENPPNPKMKIKIEINTREHFAIEGVKKINLECRSDWFTGSADVVTFSKEELLATKLRALYQRRKGRDLFDLWVAREVEHDYKRTVNILKTYLKKENLRILKKDFIDNLNAKTEDPIFLNDIIPLIRESSDYDIKEAFEYVRGTYLGYM